HALHYPLLLDCFFFQAEDGIRDFHVTGVQTCALPISARRDRGAACAMRFVRGMPSTRVGASPWTVPRRAGAGSARAPAPEGRARSEERRAGKEWRAGGAAEH